MGSLEVFSMIAALTIMFAAIGVKVITSQLVSRMQHTIGLVTQSRQQALGRFKLAQSQNKVSQRNRALLEKRKAKLHKKITRLRKELSTMRGEVENRQKMRDTMRGKLIRPTLAGPQPDAPGTEPPHDPDAG